MKKNKKPIPRLSVYDDEGYPLIKLNNKLMKKKTKKAKVVKKNPQDSTRRNVQAANRRFVRIENRLSTIEAILKLQLSRINKLEEK